jgi:nicotinamidase-related amidase
LRVAHGLVIVDIQKDYLPGGAYPLEGPEAAAASAAQLLAGFRAAGNPVFHVQHIWDEEDATFMRPGTDGVQIHESVAPLDGETVISKEHPNSFRETELEAELRKASVDELVVCGMMTSMCVDATVRAVDLGFDTTVAHDACATRRPRRRRTCPRSHPSDPRSARPCPRSARAARRTRPVASARPAWARLRMRRHSSFAVGSPIADRGYFPRADVSLRAGRRLH